MSNLARAWAERQDPGSGCRLHLLEVIAAFHNDDLGFCTASNRYLAARLRKSEATIERGLTALEARGLIRRETTRWGPDGGARRRIHLPGYDPIAVERELRARRDQARERRSARHSALAVGSGPAGSAERPEARVGSPQDEGQVPSFCGPGPLILGGSESLAESQEEESSEPDGSGPGTPAPGRKILFSEGRSTLVALGLDRRTAGDVIARWLRDTDDDAPRVLDAIRGAREHGALSPIPWITAHLRQPRTDHARFDRQPALARALDGLADQLRLMEQL